jgi:hypothetical protein
MTERPKNPNWKRGLNPQRVWAAARDKIREEAACRRCRSPYSLEAAHIIPRSRVGARRGAEDADNIIPLCSRDHAAQHAGLWELGPFLTDAEWAHARLLVGDGEAERRLSPSIVRQTLDNEAA